MFPTNYVEIRKDDVRVHRAFGRDLILRYDEFFYIRLNPNRHKEFALIYLREIVRTIEIRKMPSCKKIHFSSFKTTFEAVAKMVRETPLADAEWVVGDYYVANSTWIAERGSPDDQKWYGF